MQLFWKSRFHLHSSLKSTTSTNVPVKTMWSLMTCKRQLLANTSNRERKSEQWGRGQKKSSEFIAFMIHKQGFVPASGLSIPISSSIDGESYLRNRLPLQLGPREELSRDFREWKGKRALFRDSQPCWVISTLVEAGFNECDCNGMGLTAA